MTKYFSDSMGKNRQSNNKITFMLNKLVADALEEASEVPPEILEFYMGQAAATLLWAATGQTVDSMPLPDDFPRERHLTVVPELPADRYREIAVVPDESA